MRFDLDDSIFAQGCPLELAALFYIGDHKHRVMFSNQDESSPAQVWLSQQSTGMAEAVRMVLDDSLEREMSDPSKVIWIVAASEIGGQRISVKQALGLMQAPLEIYVENQENDGAFLKAVMKSEQRTILQQAIDSDIVRFVHGGGGNTMKTNLQALPADPVKNSKRLALFDSDALLPNIPGSTAIRLKSICDERSIPWHCLERRAAENYLTKSQLYAWVQKPRYDSQRKAKVDAFESCMSEEQQHHFRMREGWESDEANDDYKKDKDTVDRFYESARLQAKEWSVLSKGFGRSIRDQFAFCPPLDKEVFAQGWTTEFAPFIEKILSRL